MLTAQLEKRRLAHKLDLDLADEQVKHKFRVEVVKIAQKELKQKRARLQVLKTRFQGVVKVSPVWPATRWFAGFRASSILATVGGEHRSANSRLSFV